MPATTNEIATAGPAWTPAALPVSTKMPVPMTTPTPNTVRSSGREFACAAVLGLVGVGDRLLDRLGPEEVHARSFCRVCSSVRPVLDAPPCSIG